MAWCMSCFYSAPLGWTPCGCSRSPILFGHPATAAPSQYGEGSWAPQMPVASWRHNLGAEMMQRG